MFDLIIYFPFLFVNSFQAFLEGVESHRGVHQLVNVTSKALLDFCQDNSLSVDTSHIVDEVQDVNVRYDKLCRANFDMEKQSRVAEQSVELYQKALQPVQQTFVEVDSYLESEPAIGLDTEKGKEELNRVEVRGILILLSSLECLLIVLLIILCGCLRIPGMQSCQ